MPSRGWTDSRGSFTPDIVLRYRFGFFSTVSTNCRTKNVLLWRNMNWNKCNPAKGQVLESMRVAVHEEEEHWQSGWGMIEVYNLLAVNWPPSRSENSILMRFFHRSNFPLLLLTRALRLPRLTPELGSGEKFHYTESH